MTQKKLMYVLGAVALWSVPGLIQMGQEVYHANLVGGSHGKLWRMAIWMVPRWWLWALAMPLVMKLARRWRPNTVNWYRVLPLHVGIAVVMAAVIILLIILYGSQVRVWGNPMPFMGQLKFGLWTMIPYVHFLAYWVICGFTWMFDGEQAMRERELHTARLESQLAGAKLEALQMQLQPHFLFNTLNSISVLMVDDVPASRKMVGRLSNLLRRTLALGNRQQVSLALEMETLEDYLAIELVRFADRLTVEVRIDPDCLDLQVPAMILQPLVENALKHGVGGKPGPAQVTIEAGRKEGALTIIVADDGVGRDSQSPERVGMSNTRARLQQLYGKRQSCEWDSPAQGGTRVRLRLPIQEAEDE